MARPLEAGDPAPEFALTAPDGAAIRLADYRGRTLVLVFARWFG